MKNILSKKILFIFAIFISILLIFNLTYATDLRGEIENIDLNTVDLNTIDIEDAISYYEENLAQNYSNDELANIIEENSDILLDKGVDPDLISTGTAILRTTNSEDVANIIKNDLNLEEIKESLGESYTTEELIKKVETQITPEKSIKIIFKLLLANYIVKTSLIICFIFFIYSIIITWIIYHKARKHGWASLIPIYRNIVLFKICGFSPWLLLLAFLPILGWAILFIISIIIKFRLAEVFDKGPLFGLGLLLFPTIFKSILAFSKAEYIGLA